MERATGRQDRAIRHFEDAVAANSSDVDSMLWLVMSYSLYVGKPAAADAIAERLISLDPVPVGNLFARVCARWAKDNFSGALAVLEEMRVGEPSLRFVNFWRICVLARMGRNEEALKAVEATLEENTVDGFAQLATVFRHALLGEREALIASLAGASQSYFWNDSDVPEWAAGWLALVGEKEKALDWLEHWVDRGSINYPMLAHGDPLLQPLRGEPR